jgi:hypothetical protein
MTRIALLAFLLATSVGTPGHADWCSGIVAENRDCLVSDSKPGIVRCDYDARRNDHRCMGIITNRRQIFDAAPVVTPDATSRRHRKKR